MRDMVAKEIFTSEETYSEFLKMMVDIYLKNAAQMLDKNDVKNLFSNVLVLYNFSIQLCKELKKRIENWEDFSLIGDVFVKFYPFFRTYTQYCNNYDNALETLNNCLKNKTFSEFCDKELQKTPNGLGPNLQSLLIMPVQRMPRYALLLKELLAKTAADHPDFENLKKWIRKNARN